MTQYLLSSDSKTLTHTLTNGLTNHAEYHLFDLNVVIGHQEKMHQSQRNFFKRINNEEITIDSEEYLSLMDKYDALLTDRSYFEKTLPSGSIKLYYGNDEQIVDTIILETNNLEEVLQNIPQLNGAIVKEISSSTDINNIRSPTHRPKTTTLSLL